MSYSLIGAHVNATVGGVAELVAQWKPPLVVILDHADVWLQAKLESPQTTFIGRIYDEEQLDFNTGLDPITAANEHCAWLLTKIEQMGADRIGRTYDYWQGLNEPVIRSHEAMQRYAIFEAERARILSANGFRAVVGSFSVGNPELAYWADFLPALEAARQYQGVLALHEYAWPRMEGDPEWLLLRHRKVYDGEPAHGWAGLPAELKTLPLLITECGLDGLLEQPYPPRGWRTLYTPEQYLAQLDWYDRQLRQDPYVAGAAIYCCGYESIQWQPYDIWPDAVQMLARQARPVYPLYETPEPPPSPTPDELDRLLQRLDEVIALLEERI